jgi:hypothetical protein
MMHAGGSGGNARHRKGLFEGQFLTFPTRGIPMGHRLFSSSTHRAMPLAALVIAASLAAPGNAATPAGDLFEQLSGDWKGGGTVTPAKGDPMKVACKATYKVTGSNLTQNLRCAGTDYRIDAILKLADKNGKIRGSWNEKTYDANGGVTGAVKDDLIHARISGDKFSGRLSINVSDNGLEINIVQLNEDTGTYRPAASVSLHR